MSAFLIFALVFLTACSGAVFKPGEWYNGLRKPSWTPPRWAFPVVWTTLYAFIGYSGWLVLQADLMMIFAVWCAQLVLNAMWSFLFFGRRKMQLALVDLLAMLLFIIVYIALTLPVLPLAGWLFVPYAVWVCAAGLLNWQMIQLNPKEAS